VTKPAIVCVSANPAMDRRIRLPKLIEGEVNRALGVQALPGGKAAHVAMAAQALGAKVVWIGFLGGSIGEECARGLRALGITVAPVEMRESTRINLELIEDCKRVTEVLEPGGLPDSAECDKMLVTLKEGLLGPWSGAAVVLSGSLPSSLSPDIYSSLVGAARAVGSKIFLDTSGEALAKTLAAGPDFVKPNRTEAETLLGRNLESPSAGAEGVRELISRGARSAAITLGGAGMVWIARKDAPVWVAKIPPLNAASTVGCGDATLAGFAYATVQGKSEEDTLKLATACGAANCLAELPGRISLADVNRLISRVEIARVEH
jgi:1-phosphofructokinase family hexose kinase